MGLTLDLDLKKCTSCGACAIACMDQNDIDIEQGMTPFRMVFDWENKENRENRYLHISIACMHCIDAPCVTACPGGCIEKDKKTNLTIYDNTNCIGCHSCAMACPFGIPSFDQNGKMRKCDGCVLRLEHGLEPACVRACPTGALRLVSTEDIKTEDEGGESLQAQGRKLLSYQT